MENLFLFWLESVILCHLKILILFAFNVSFPLKAFLFYFQSFNIFCVLFARADNAQGRQHHIDPASAAVSMLAVYSRHCWHSVCWLFGHAHWFKLHFLFACLNISLHLKKSKREIPFMLDVCLIIFLFQCMEYKLRECIITVILK